MTIKKVEDQTSRGTPRGAGDPRSKDKVRVVIVRSIPMIETSNKYCRCLTFDGRELVTHSLNLGQGMVD